MEKYIINTDSFILPFLLNVENDLSLDNSDQVDNESEDELDEDTDGNEEDKSPEQQFEEMEDLIPKEAVFIGSIDTELRNWISWTVKEEYYVIRLKDQEFEWALFRICWDDNEENWEWSSDARLKGDVDKAEIAARIMLKQIWTDWGIDYEIENSPYHEIIDRLN
jgi:hypothetical protein